MEADEAIMEKGALASPRIVSSFPLVKALGDAPETRQRHPLATLLNERLVESA